MNQKIVRTLCMFAPSVSPTTAERLNTLSGRLKRAGFEVQTRRIATRAQSPARLEREVIDPEVMLAMGSLSPVDPRRVLGEFCQASRVSAHLDLTDAAIDDTAVAFLRELIAARPERTFQFAFSFRQPEGSPYFPSAQCGSAGFALGLQPTNLAAGCANLEDWFASLVATWNELVALFGDEPDFLGIDSSTAPLGAGPGSLLHHLSRWYGPLHQLVLSEVFVRLSEFLKTKNPRPTGLCGLMLPCLEDFVLAEAYEEGGFSIERNLFLSLHSGLGIDTYPIGTDESPEALLQVLKLVQALSAKHHKPLSVRFISDGKARIGDRTSFASPYLKDVVVRPLFPAAGR